MSRRRASEARGGYAWAWLSTRRRTALARARHADRRRGRARRRCCPDWQRNGGAGYNSLARACGYFCGGAVGQRGRRTALPAGASGVAVTENRSCTVHRRALSGCLHYCPPAPDAIWFWSDPIPFRGMFERLRPHRTGNQVVHWEGYGTGPPVLAVYSSSSYATRIIHCWTGGYLPASTLSRLGWIGRSWTRNSGCGLWLVRAGSERNMKLAATPNLLVLNDDVLSCTR